MRKCVTAPVMKRTRNTQVRGTSKDLFGIPPNTAPVDAKGPFLFFLIIAGKVDVELAKAASKEFVGQSAGIDAGGTTSGIVTETNAGSSVDVDALANTGLGVCMMAALRVSVGKVTPAATGEVAGVSGRVILGTARCKVVVAASVVTVPSVDWGRTVTVVAAPPT